VLHVAIAAVSRAFPLFFIIRSAVVVAGVADDMTAAKTHDRRPAPFMWIEGPLDYRWSGWQQARAYGGDPLPGGQGFFDFRRRHAKRNTVCVYSGRNSVVRRAGHTRHIAMRCLARRLSRRSGSC